MQHDTPSEPRLIQARADLSHALRLVPRAAARRMVQGFGPGAEQRIEPFLAGKAPAIALSEDRPLLMALSLACASPSEDRTSFLAANLLLLLHCLERAEPDRGAFWSDRWLYPAVRALDPPCRSALMCGFRVAGTLGWIHLDTLPGEQDCLNRDRDEVLSRLADCNAWLLAHRIGVLVARDATPQDAGTFWVRRSREIYALPDAPRCAAIGGLRYLYERHAAISVPPGSRFHPLPPPD